MTLRLPGPVRTGIADLDPVGDPRWADLLDRSHDPSPFHHPAWLELLARTFGYRTGAWAVSDAGGRLLAGIPVALVASPITGRRLVSVPFADLCQPLLRPEADQATVQDLLARVAEEHRTRGADVELRFEAPGGGAWAAGDRFWHHVVPLRGFDRAKLKPAVRQAVRKAERTGITIRTANDAAALDSFYTLHQHTRRRLGVPTQPKRFIRGFEALFDRGLGWLMLAELEQVPVAAAVFLQAGGTVVYKYGASDSHHLDLRPNNLLMLSAIERAVADGATDFDMGRTDIGHEGLRAFKRSWGAEERELAYTRLSVRTRAARRGGAGVPTIARRLIRSSPPVFGRLVGEALYRHYG
jgi:CelD/BcsL family acetyltransferase involved in cellulose biosynthesis